MTHSQCHSCQAPTVEAPDTSLISLRQQVQRNPCTRASLGQFPRAPLLSTKSRFRAISGEESVPPAPPNVDPNSGFDTVHDAPRLPRGSVRNCHRTECATRILPEYLHHAITRDHCNHFRHKIEPNQSRARSHVLATRSSPN